LSFNAYGIITIVKQQIKSKQIAISYRTNTGHFDRIINEIKGELSSMVLAKVHRKKIKKYIELYESI